MRTPLAVIVMLLAAGLGLLAFPGDNPNAQGLSFEGEKHLANIRQLTHGGENAEAYWSIDDKQLIFQSAHGDVKCDQIFVMNADGSDMHMVSTGKGRTTCSYIFPDGKHILYASTHGGSPNCPPPPDFSKGYRWMLYPDYDIYVADIDGKNPRNLSSAPGYDAEATISRDGKKIAFTSERDGDLDIYTMDADGRNVKRLTNETGYDGGPFWSYDGNWIVYRAYHPKSPEQVEEYQQLMKEHAIKPMSLEIWVMKADGSEKRQLTKYGAASFAPYFFPDGTKIIFSSNMADAKGMGNFDLYSINLDGSGLERITTNPTFDGFPMFTSDGKRIVFASNRNAAKPHETNVFVADWRD